MNLFQKLVEIQKSVRALGKNSSAGVGASSYQYVSGSKVLDFIRPKMDELGILLVQQVDSIENERVDYNTKNGVKSELLSKVNMTFTWIDAESGEKLSVPFGANGMNNWDKGLGSALTYAERYFLLKFFHIATDEDDVDALPPRGNEDALPPKPKKERMHRNHEKWDSMLKSILEGKCTLEQVKAKYDFPEADEIAAKEWILTHTNL